MAASASLSHLFVLVSDLERSRVFYVDVLGLRIADDLGSYIRLEGARGFHIGMEQGPPERVGGRGVEIEILVDDVDRRHEEMARKGVVFSSPPTDMEWGARHAFFEDPDGYPMSIFTPLA